MKTYTRTLYGVANAKVIRCQTEQQAKEWIAKMHPGCVWTHLPGDAGPYYMYGHGGGIQMLYTLGPGPRRLAGAKEGGRAVGTAVKLRVAGTHGWSKDQPRGWLAVFEVTPENRHHLDPLAKKAERRRQGGCRTKPDGSRSGSTRSSTRTSPT